MSHDFTPLACPWQVPQGMATVGGILSFFLGYFASIVVYESVCDAHAYENVLA